MAKVASANPKAFGVVDANEVSGFKTVQKVADLQNIMPGILSISYNSDKTSDGSDAIGQRWYVAEYGGYYELKTWSNDNGTVVTTWDAVTDATSDMDPISDDSINNLFN